MLPFLLFNRISCIMTRWHTKFTNKLTLMKLALKPISMEMNVIKYVSNSKCASSHIFHRILYHDMVVCMYDWKKNTSWIQISLLIKSSYLTVTNGTTKNLPKKRFSQFYKLLKCKCYDLTSVANVYSFPCITTVLKTKYS
jgi:hypothetical protein